MTKLVFLPYIFYDKCHNCTCGKFSQSNDKSDWNDIKYAIEGAEISNKENIDDLDLYNIYDE